MRPPQFAGESRRRRLDPPIDRLASMRPPQFAGESPQAVAAGRVCWDVASMRPPQFAGESMDAPVEIDMGLELQ